MPSVSLQSLTVNIMDTPEARAQALARLAFHRAVLENQGVPTVSGLGDLALSGVVAARPGVVVPARPGLFTPPGVIPVLHRQPPVGVLLPSGTTALQAAFAEPVLPPSARMMAAPATRATLDVAYFVAESVDLADDTVVVLNRPHQYLTFIAERIKVGRGVTFTYEHPLPGAPVASWAPGDKPPKPSKAPTPDGHWGVTGDPGGDGLPGGEAWAGVDAPEVEMWVLELTGAPVFDLRGQDGRTGGRGRDGGDGGDGSDGMAERYDFLGFCSSGAGAGGDGGPGGSGGNGGRGGPGGHGGRLGLYAPSPVLQTYAAGGFSISTEGGSGGAGGGPGAPGAGGVGGRLGPRPKNCSMSEERHDGAPGAQGRQGAIGSPGPHGGQHLDSVRFVPVSRDEFAAKLTEPALVRADPPRAVAGATVTLHGVRLLPDDVLTISDQPVPMTVIADTLATFNVPAVIGGNQTLRVRRAGGVRSNNLSFYVLPQVAAVGDGSRVKPGTTVTVTGSGFAPGARVRVNGEDMPGSSYVNGATMTFTLQRPVNTAEDADGETGLCEVILNDGTPSNAVAFTIDTLVILVIGDSVAWGQGLRPHEKYVGIVERSLGEAGGGIKSYTAMLAHSGATIGVGDNTVLPALPGEIPTSYPTVMQQLGAYGGTPDRVDIVLVTAGLNDVNIRSIVNPMARPRDFAGPVDAFCRRDLRTLLTAAAAQFPNATIVATPYYPILSEDSDTTLLSAFLVAVGISVAGLPGGILTGSLIPQVITNCRAFHDLSQLAIAAAVDEANDDLPVARICYAGPGFAAENAALASQAWVYGINGDLSPQDVFVAGGRAPACDLNADRTDVFQCARASIGHPNPAGARAYANAVLRALRTGPADEEASLPPFPPGFLFGVATAAMQNEGGITNNDWAAFVDSPAIRRRVRAWTAKDGHPVDLSGPGEALRHADLTVLKADLDRAAALGINSYRFSVEWARIQPARATHGNPLTDSDLDMTAVGYYDGVLDALAARNMTPVLTLNHLSLPLWVLDPPREATIGSAVGLPFASGDDPDFRASMRGWENAETVDAFLAFVTYLAARWSARVRWWITLNEPVGSMIGVGYIAGIWPPGFTGDGGRARTAYFNLIRAHTRAYETIKAADSESMVGLAHAMLHARVTTAVTDHVLGDQEAARNQFDYFYNWHMLDAIIDGRLDTAIHRRPGNRVYLTDADLAAFLGTDATKPWSSHCDFVGLNFYRSVYVFADVLVSLTASYTGGRFVNNLDGSDQVHQLLNDLGWEISPSGFGAMLRDLKSRYGLPVLVTENGIPQAQDHHRGPFLVAHLTQLLAAVRDGVDIRGYLYWTLADNWEWHEGYRPAAHFGLYTVDRSDPALPRHLTPGAHAYAYAIGRGDLRGARQLFGDISPGGDRVRPARRSPALFTGTLDGKPIAITVRQDPDGWLRGFLSEPGSGRPVPLLGTLDASLGLLTLRHPAGPGGSLGQGSFSGRRTGDPLIFAGQYERDGATTALEITKNPLVGAWVGDAPLLQVQIGPAPGDPSAWVAAWMSDTSPRGWSPLAIRVEGASVTLEAGGNRVVGRRMGDRLTGDITASGETRPWTGRRLDDGFPA
ncbi:family 1 glycosylhydrolase [Frankia sp. Cr1]|uniref:family 1 glycosylhydrolase n=1 Tax=Frankia sp. Cr1 TaxID=3073931 RepID=UPI002AD26D0B|nr:family 1 glycosylhydrolase [Frankia sp. Cr1]